MIKDIFSEGDLVGYVGNDVFKLTYLDQLVDYFEDNSVDRIFMKGDMFLSAD